MSKCRWYVVCALALILLYVGAYGLLSRRGYREATEWNINGFYYLKPESSTRWRVLNNACRIMFAPLNLLDQWIGLGKPPACDPLWSVS